MYLGGEFIRSESGRTRSLKIHGKDVQYARVCEASVKDFRNAVVHAKKGHDVWKEYSAYLKGQILYRMAEMCEGKREELKSLFVLSQGVKEEQASEWVQAGIDSLVYYAGFADKYQQISSSVNPVKDSFLHISHQESLGVCVIIDQAKFSWQHLLDCLCSMLVAGNSVIMLLGQACPALLGPLGEIIATADIPHGAINLMSGNLNELWEAIAGHQEVRGIGYLHEDQSYLHSMKKAAVGNLKRISTPQETRNLDNILGFSECKSTWHPVNF